MQGNWLIGFLAWGHGAGIVLLVVAMWGAVCYLASWMGGWHTLAQRFRCEQAFEGERWPFRSGSMRRGTHYNGVLTLGANREGLSLAVFVAFRAGHPPLFIPWSEITATERRRWFVEGTQFVLGREEQIPLWVSKGTGETLLPFRPVESSVLQRLYSRPGLEEPRKPEQRLVAAAKFGEQPDDFEIEPD